MSLCLFSLLILVLLKNALLLNLISSDRRQDNGGPQKSMGSHCSCSVDGRALFHYPNQYNAMDCTATGMDIDIWCDISTRLWYFNESFLVKGCSF